MLFVALRLHEPLFDRYREHPEREPHRFQDVLAGE